MSIWFRNRRQKVRLASQDGDGDAAKTPFHIGAPGDADNGSGDWSDDAGDGDVDGDAAERDELGDGYETSSDASAPSPSKHTEAAAALPLGGSKAVASHEAAARPHEQLDLLATLATHLHRATEEEEAKDGHQATEAPAAKTLPSEAELGAPTHDAMQKLHRNPSPTQDLSALGQMKTLPPGPYTAPVHTSTQAAAPPCTLGSFVSPDPSTCSSIGYLAPDLSTLSNASVPPLPPSALPPGVHCAPTPLVSPDPTAYSAAGSFAAYAAAVAPLSMQQRAVADWSTYAGVRFTLGEPQSMHLGSAAEHASRQQYISWRAAQLEKEIAEGKLAAGWPMPLSMAHMRPY